MDTPWIKKPVILQLAQTLPDTLLRLQRLVLLQRLLRVKKQMELAKKKPNE